MDDIRTIFQRHPGSMGRLTSVIVGPDAYDELVAEHGLAHLTALGDEYGVEIVRAEEPLARETATRDADWYSQQIAEMTDLPF